MVIYQLVNLGVAEKGPDGGEELIWKFPKRVVTLDETSTSQRSNHQHDKRSSAKVLLPESVLVDKQGRTFGAPVAAEHITLVVGYNFDGDLLPPGWIFKGSSPGLTRNKTAMLDNLAKKYFSSDQLGICNDTAYDSAPAVASENGSATQENFGLLLLSILKLVYRDASDESPEKRVVVFADGHVSRFNVQHLRKLCEAGIYLVLYPPNCTSKMQTANTMGSNSRIQNQKDDGGGGHAGPDQVVSIVRSQKWTWHEPDRTGPILISIKGCSSGRLKFLTRILPQRKTRTTSMTKGELPIGNKKVSHEEHQSSAVMLALLQCGSHEAQFTEA